MEIIREVMHIITNNRFTFMVSIASAWVLIFYILLFIDKAICDKISKVCDVVILSSFIIILVVLIIK